MTFVSELNAALEIRNGKDSAEAVHRIVVNGLRELDPQARLRQTGYFNHSWAPDFVATWDDNPAGRHVFLRFDVANAGFLRDVELLGADQPIFMGLRADEEHAGESARSAVAKMATESQTLVTEAPAVESLQKTVAQRQDVRTATRALVRGGRGVVDSQAAHSFASSYNRILGEIDGEKRTGELRAGLNSLEEFLNENASALFERAMRSRWIGAGGAPADFPGLDAWTLMSRTPDEIADLVEALLDQDEHVPLKQWREIASSVSMDALGVALRTRKHRQGERLNDLLRSALDIWSAQWVHARPLPSDTFEGVYEWFLSTYGFGLRLRNREVFFSDDGRRFSQVQGDAQLPEIAVRGPLLDDRAIKGIGLVTPQEDVTIALRESATHSIGSLIDDLVAKESPIWRSALIADMGVEVPAYAAEVNIDFKRNVMAAARPLPIRVLISLVGQYVSAMSESELRELEDGQVAN